MKTKHLLTTLVLGIFCLSLTTVSCSQGGSSKKTNEAEVTFVVNIDCAGCKKTLETKLPLVTGVKEVKVDLEKTEVWVLFYKDKTDKAKLIEAIQEIGYIATEKAKS